MGVNLRLSDLTYYKCGVLLGSPIIKTNNNGKQFAFFSKNQVIINDTLNIGEYVFTSNVASNLGDMSLKIFRYNGTQQPAQTYNRQGVSAYGNGVTSYVPNVSWEPIWALLCDGSSIESSNYVYSGFVEHDWVQLPNDGFSYLLGTAFDDENGYLYISLADPRYIGSLIDELGINKADKIWFSNLISTYTASDFPNDPLSGGGISGVGGTGSGGTGGGNWSAPSDNINFPTTPTVPDIMQTGLFSAYAMTTAELQTFGDYLWNGDFFDIIQKIASDPLDSIIGLSVFPFDLSTVASESVPLKVGNATVNDLQTVSKLQTNMKTISCGSINISHYSGNAMDYAPYTKLQIYLPYIGIRDLNINDFMNSIIKVDYAIDILTGSCCAYISTVNDGVNKVLYTFTGKMSADIPISGRNYATLIGAISTLATAGALATTLGGALPIAGATLLSASKMVANSQPQVEHSGNFNSHLSLNLLQTPYLIITRPRQSLPQSFNSFKGYPSNITERLGNLNGYTEVEYVHMDGFPNATKEEILEIETLLKSGVIL